MTTLRTPRLRLEPFADRHLDGLHEMNRLPEVMRYISGERESREQTAAGIARVQRAWAILGTSWWAFIETGSERVIGAGCIQYSRQEAAPPADLASLRGNPLEIGWRLHPDVWGKGYASEAATRMATFAFDTLGAPELIAVRDPDNAASARVMDRLGMHHRGVERFYGLDLATHAISREDWLRAHAVEPNPRGALRNRVIESINNPTGDHCVDIFVRDDGTFGFEEYRRDPEDARGWFPLNRHGARSFATAEAALLEAKLSVAWMSE